MKNKIISSVLKSAYLLLFISIVFSCGSDDPVELPINPEKPIYLVDYTKVKTCSKNDIKGVLLALNIALGANLPGKEFTNGVDLYRIRYNTTFEGKKVVASGIVAIPDKSAVFPLLSFQHGTNVQHEKAPSVNYKNEIFKLINVTSSAGFIISVPDYLGFGESKQMFHPYMNKKSTVNSIIDMLKATEELTNTGDISARASKDLYLNGYSQGGWATMCVQKELETVQKDLFNIKASSCGAGPYNLETVLEFILSNEHYDNPYFLAYVFNTMIKMDKADSELLKKIFKEPFSDRVLDAFDGIKTEKEINKLFTTLVKGLFTKDFIDNYKTSPDFKQVRDFLENNSVGFWKTSIPTRLYHGTEDVDIPLINSQEAYNEMRNLGVSKEMVKLIEIPNSNHGTSIIPTELNTIRWFLELKK